MLHALDTVDARSTLPASPGAGVDERFVSSPILDRYIEGWAEADPAKIAGATAEGCDLHDPLVGRFSKRALPQLLRAAAFAPFGGGRPTYKSATQSS